MKSTYSLLNLFGLILWFAVLMGAMIQISPPVIAFPFFLYSAVAFALVPSLIPFGLLGTSKGITYSVILTLATAIVLRVMILDFHYPILTILSWFGVVAILVPVLLLTARPLFGDRQSRIQMLAPAIGLYVSWATGLTLFAKRLEIFHFLFSVCIGVFVLVMMIVYVAIVPVGIRWYQKTGGVTLR